MFFRAKDPEALAAWYEEMLGVTQVPDDYNTPPWAQEAGLTVFAPFQSIPIISATHSKSG